MELSQIPAQRIGDGQAGFIIASLRKVDEAGSESLVLVFESSADGSMEELSVEAVKFNPPLS